MKPCFQITSSKLVSELLFRDEEDYIFGMNSLALILLSFPTVTVYAFVLMSNHIHLVLGGRKEDCEAYYDAVMHRLSLMLRRKYGLSGIVPYGPKNRTTITVNGLDHFIVEVLSKTTGNFPIKNSSGCATPFPSALDLRRSSCSGSSVLTSTSRRICFEGSARLIS